MKSEPNFAPEQLIRQLDTWLRLWSPEGTGPINPELVRRCRAALEATAVPRDYLGNIVGTELVHSRYVADTTTEIIRLRTALKTIQQWDCLNPPRADLLSDLPWLRRVVDAALQSNSPVSPGQASSLTSRSDARESKGGM